MSETPPPMPDVPEKGSESLGTSHTAWPSPVTHRRPAMVVLIAVLILLLVVLAGIVIVQARKLVDLGERIERLEPK